MTAKIMSVSGAGISGAAVGHAQQRRAEATAEQPAVGLREHAVGDLVGAPTWS